MKTRMALRKFVAGVTRRFSYEVACNGAERIVEKKVRGDLKKSSRSVPLLLLTLLTLLTRLCPLLGSGTSAFWPSVV